MIMMNFVTGFECFACSSRCAGTGPGLEEYW